MLVTRAGLTPGCRECTRAGALQARASRTVREVSQDRKGGQGHQLLALWRLMTRWPTSKTLANRLSTKPLCPPGAPTATPSCAPPVGAAGPAPALPLSALAGGEESSSSTFAMAPILLDETDDSGLLAEETRTPCKPVLGGN